MHKAAIPALYRQRNDFVSYAEESKTAYLKSFADAEERLKNEKDKHPVMRPSDEYIGDYCNTLGDFYIRVFKTENGLTMNFQGEDWDVYELQPYAKDTFSWWVPRDEQAKRGRWLRVAENYFKLQFTSTENGDIESVLWLHDPAVTAGEKFYKQASE